MFGVILACSVLIGYVIDLSVWQAITITVLTMATYSTGRALGKPHGKSGANY